MKKKKQKKPTLANAAKAAREAAKAIDKVLGPGASQKARRAFHNRFKDTPPIHERGKGDPHIQKQLKNMLELSLKQFRTSEEHLRIRTTEVERLKEEFEQQRKDLEQVQYEAGYPRSRIRDLVDLYDMLRSTGMIDEIDGFEQTYRVVW